jgi:hypothetical protein
VAGVVSNAAIDRSGTINTCLTCFAIVLSCEFRNNFEHSAQGHPHHFVQDSNHLETQRNPLRNLSYIAGIVRNWRQHLEFSSATDKRSFTTP